MRYIIFSDLHLHSWSGEIDPDTRLSKRLLIQKSILQQIIDLAIENDAIILFGGDMVHAVGNVPVEVINVMYWFFEEIKKCGLKFYSVLGNHDISIRKNCPSTHSILSPFQNREQRDKELSLLKPTIKFVDYDQIDEVENIKGWDIVLIHAQPDLINKHKHHMEGINWQKISKKNRFVFFGHYHTTRKLSAMCYIIGSPMQLTMNDTDEERGCWTVDSENWHVDFHKLDYPELKRIEKIESKEEVKFEERIKATSFQDILVEWLDKEQKPQFYLELIQKDITDKIQVTKNVFNGKIRNIYLKDFLSIDEIKIEYKNGFWLVLGPNGSGKTTIFEGILWTLFDDTTKDLAKGEVIRDRPTKQKEAIGELNLIDDKHFYTIRRSSKNGLEVICDEKNVVEGMTKIQAQDFLEKNVLGFDKNTFMASCYFSQEQLLTLAQLGDSETTNLVTNLLGFETYDSLHQLMNDKIKEVTLQNEQLEKSSVKIKQDIFINEVEQRNLKEQIEMLTKQQCSLKDEQSKVTIQIGELTTLLGNIVVPSVTTEGLDVTLLALNNDKTEMSTKYRTLQESGQLKINELRMSLNLVNTKLQNILQEQSKIDKEKTKLETERRLKLESISNHEAIIASLKENKCIYCGTILKKDELEKHISEEQATISLIKSTLQDKTPELDKQLNSLYDQEAEIREKIESINLEIEKIDAENKNAISLNSADINKIEEQISQIQKKKDTTLKEQIEANSYKANLTSQIKQLEQRKLTLVNQVSEVNINDKLLQLKELEEKFIKLMSEKNTIISDKNKLNDNKSIYEFWYNAFSNKGIRPLLLDKFVNEFNQIVLPYCYEANNGEFIVEFTPTAKLKSGLERNKLGLQVIEKDKIRNYKALSGGEKTRVNLPLCLGLNKWVSTKFRIQNGILGLIVLDELFAWTDDKFRDNVADLLNEEGKTKSIFVIDHNTTLASYTNNLWQVSKEDEITKLEVI